MTFTGRERELAELARWRDASVPGLSVMLIHGAGGQGKTRLAAQFGADSAARGWTVWAAHHLSDPTALTVVAPGDTGQALLLVVEYAERWPADDLQLLLENPLLGRPSRARVLLVARPAGPWWPSLRHRLGKADIDVGGSMQLAPLADTPSERRSLFTAARDQFAAIFGVAGSSVDVPAGLDADGFELVLTIHMAALAAVDAHVRGRTPAAYPVGLSAYLLDREHDYWQSIYDHGQVATQPQIMSRVVYTATLTNPMRTARGVAVLERAAIATRINSNRLLDDHAICYPPTTSDTVLQPLYPDRLGEDFLALQTPGHAIADYVPDD